MTGRDLIIYILQNGLEDKPVFENGKFIAFLTVDEAALKFHVGPETIKAWCELGILKGVKVGETLYIFANSKLDYHKAMFD